MYCNKCSHNLSRDIMHALLPFSVAILMKLIDI